MRHWDSMGLYETLWMQWDCMSLHETLWDNRRHREAVWDIMRHYDTAWDTETIRDIMRHYDRAWDTMRHYEMQWDFIREMANSSKPKLRLYVNFKTEYGKTEEYVQKVRVKSHRSLLAQLRGGTAPLQIETGRYIGLPVEGRICRSSNTREVEDEQHFCVGCPALEEARPPPFCTSWTSIMWTQEHSLTRTSSSQSCRAQTVEQPNFFIICF